MKIDIDALGKKSRPQDMNGTLAVLRNDFWKFASWGAEGFQKHKDRVLKFKVNGHHHKGYVYLAVSGSDLYDAYLTDLMGEIVKEVKDMYFDELVDRLDVVIEKVESYQR